MKSVLNVSIAFPPKFDSEGLVVAKYYKYITTACQDRFHLDVVTSKVPTLNMHYDPALESAAEGVRQTIALKVWENRYSNYLLRHLWPTLYFSPDSKFTFHWQWRTVAKRLHQPPDLIYSRSFPASSAIMAMKLKAHYNVPWVMHLSDPWADSPHTAYRGRARARNQVLERKVFEAADVIALTSHRTIEYFQNKYSDLNKRYEFYPNVYDPEDLPSHQPQAKPAGSKLRLVHTGGLAGSRSPEPFLKALTSLPADLQERIEVVFAGWVDRANMEVLDRYACDSFTYLGPLDSYKEALQLQRSADVLVLIDFPVKDPQLRVYFLSKLLDYQIAGKPILGVIDEGSECHRFIEDGFGHCFAREDVKGIRQHLLWLLERHEKEDSDYFRHREPHTEYDAKHNAERLTELFAELTG